jgi:hypothetical protein
MPLNGEKEGGGEMKRGKRGRGGRGTRDFREGGMSLEMRDAVARTQKESIDAYL